MNLYLVRLDTPCLEISEELSYHAPNIQNPLSISHKALEKTLVKGDILLFWTECRQDEKYQNVIFAYFQVDRVCSGTAFAKERLSFDNSRPGFGTLSFSKKRVLTRNYSEKNCWSLPEIFRCMRVEYGAKNLFGKFKTQGQIRYFENTTPFIRISAVLSKASGEYFENALLEWISSMCEDIRSDTTRELERLKKGTAGEGKTGFAEYIYAPDNRGAIYCRHAHRVKKRDLNACRRCPLFKKKNGKAACLWSLPVYGASPYIPLTLADSFAYFDVLLEKGLVMDWRDM